MNPQQQFNDDRDRAHLANDPMAHLCTVANVDQHQQAQLRTLVLREVDGELAIFINATSPKWTHLQSICALHTYWPSVQLQYRFVVETSPVPPSVVAANWLLRPPPPQRMDWYYESATPQSQAIESREVLLDTLSQVTLPEPLHAPENARGLILRPVEIERLDLTQENGVHLRQRFIKQAGQWRVEMLVP